MIFLPMVFFFDFYLYYHFPLSCPDQEIVMESPTKIRGGSLTHHSYAVS